MRTILLAMFLVWCGTVFAAAQDVAAMPGARPADRPLSDLAAPDLAAVVAALPAPTLKRLRTEPEKMVALAALLIAGAGQGGRIDAPGVERHIALRLAEARSRPMARMLAADLDNDGRITAPELAARMAASEERDRAWIGVAHPAADADRDGTVDMAELRGFAEAEAAGSLSESRRALIRSLLLCDADGDGWISLDDLRAVARATAAVADPDTDTDT